MNGIRSDVWASGSSPAGEFYATDSTSCSNRGLLESECKGDLGRTLGFDERLLASLFRKALSPRPLGDYQKSLTLLSYRGTLSIRDRLCRHGWFSSLSPPRCGLSRKLFCIHSCNTQCRRIYLTTPDIRLSHLERIQESAESIIKIDSPLILNKEG